MLAPVQAAPLGPAADQITGTRPLRARLPWRYVINGQAASTRSMRLRHVQKRAAGIATRYWVCVLSRVMLTVTRLRFHIAVSGTIQPGGCVLVSDHDSYWDGVVAAALDPRIVPVVSRKWREIRVVGWFLDRYGVLWTGEDTVERATVVVADGGVVWIAPFGFPRDGVRTPAHHGAAHICMRGDVPLVPVALEGLASSSRRRWRRGKASARIGTPMSPAPEEDATRFTARLEAVLRSTQAEAPPP